MFYVSIITLIPFFLISWTICIEYPISFSAFLLYRLACFALNSGLKLFLFFAAAAAAASHIRQFFVAAAVAVAAVAAAAASGCHLDYVVAPVVAVVITVRLRMQHDNDDCRR